MALTNLPLVTLVIPAFNEAANIESTIRALSSFTLEKYHLEILIVVEKSRDETLSLSRASAEADCRIHILEQARQQGKGFAVRAGMLVARGEIIFFMDADLSTPLIEVEKFLLYFEEHPQVDVLIGDRQHPASKILRRQNWMREAMGKTFNFLVQKLALSGINDTQCGFKAFRRATVFPIFSRQRLVGFAFDVEILRLARHLNFSICPLPVQWRDSNNSKVRMVRDSLIMLKDIFLIKKRIKKSHFDDKATTRQSPRSP